MKKIFAILILSLAFILPACNGGDNGNKPPENIGTEDGPVVDPDAINKIIESFSSPIETAALIEDLKVPYSNKYLISTEITDDFDSNYKKALGLGMLSSDLGYLNVYQRTNSIVEYLTVIRRLSDDLDVDQFFDFQTLKRLATNNEDLDSLMFLSVNSYNRMDEHLRKTQRSDLSALMVTGVWLEGLYLACQVNKQSDNKELRNRIGEQKNILNDLLLVLKFFEKKQHFPEIIADFTELKEAFENVKITIQVGESKSQMDDKGHYVIVQDEFTIVEMTEDQLQEIIRLVEKIRNKLISV
jgi:hypothetical protein